jgi:CRISPR/Cas system CMR-associated protein Cmr5 small subunit
LCTAIKYLHGAAGIGLGTTIKYLRRTTSVAANNGLGTTINFLMNKNAGAGNYWAKAHIHKSWARIQKTPPVV